FVVWDQSGRMVPLWVPSLWGLILSVMWILVSLNIRATTWSWFETIRDLEKQGGDGERPFIRFDEHLRRFTRSDDLRRTLSIGKADAFLSVTRLLTMFGLLMAISFAGLIVVSLVPGSAHPRPAKSDALPGLRGGKDSVIVRPTAPHKAP